LLHEVAHNWWGNSVSPSSWNDIWLNEGFATYSEALYFEKISGKNALISTMHSFKYRIDFDDNQTLHSPGRNIFSSTVYNKGAWVLHMLRKEIGDSLFFSGIKTYHSKYKYGNSSTKELQTFFEKISNKKLDQFFDQWVYKGTGYIELNITALEEKVTRDSTIINVKIEQNQDGYENYSFPIDVEIMDSKDKSHNYSFYISSDTTISISTNYIFKSIMFDKDNWLLANINY
jgi:aminopeptidase N